MKWTQDAEDAIKKVPFFVRKRVRARVEKEAMTEGKKVVSLAEVKATQTRYLEADTMIVAIGQQADNAIFRSSGLDQHSLSRVDPVTYQTSVEKIFAAADVVVSMGGYNTLCEILSQGTLSLVIPRETPRKEQLIRAQTFQRQKLVDYIPWDEFKSDVLLKKILALLENPQPYQDAISRFRLTGIETMRQRLQEFRYKKA